ncbi:MAG: hypothetical protein QNJ82_15535 [Gammaproteobacteria bacterium]|nr:hypothetical protein [Gammaproteobacteria bacterium]
MGRRTRMTESAMARRDYAKAQRYLLRGLRVQPDNSRLLALRKEVPMAPQQDLRPTN